MDKKTVMVIDDDPGIQEMLEATITLAEYDCVIASDGVDALNKLQNNLPDLILLDLMMPRMNGVELLQELERLQLRQSLPIILLTAHGKDADVQKLAVNGFLMKPFELNQLLDLMAKYLS